MATSKKNYPANVGPDGIIRREKDGSHSVFVWNDYNPEPEKYDLSYEGAEAILIEGDQALWCKSFERKKIYLPKEREQAFDAHLRSQLNPFIISMNGYSSINADMREQYGIDEGAYEAACKALLKETVGHVRRKFESSNVIITDGASHMGVDGAIMAAADELGIKTLGFSCPHFMMYVNDDERPVYVSASKDDYADNYIRPLHLLITTGGREHALKHDITASIKFQVKIHFVDLISAVSEIPVPATIPDGDGGRKVENACAAFGDLVSFSDIGHLSITTQNEVGDWFHALVDDVARVAIGECRNRMPVTHRFPAH